MNAVMLDYRTPTAPFSLAAGPCRIDGALMLRLNEAPGVSALYLDAVVQVPAEGSACSSPGEPSAARAFRGDLVQWRSPLRTALLRDRRYLTANLLVQIDILADAVVGQTGIVSFFVAGQPLFSTPISMAGTATLTSDASVGPTLIRKGAAFTFTPASPVSNGSLVARDLHIVTDLTSVDASGILSSWPMPPAAPPPGAVPAPVIAAPR